MAAFVHSPQGRAVLALPGQDVVFVQGAITPKQVGSHRPSYINAILIQSRGNVVLGPCTACQGSRPGLRPVPGVPSSSRALPGVLRQLQMACSCVQMLRTGRHSRGDVRRMTIPAKVAANRRSKLVRQLRMPLFWHRYVQGWGKSKKISTTPNKIWLFSMPDSSLSRGTLSGRAYFVDNQGLGNSYEVLCPLKIRRSLPICGGSSPKL